MNRPIASIFVCALLTLAAAPSTGPIITTVAGGGPDQLPLSESLVLPCSLTVAPSGDLIVLGFMSRIYRVDAAGVVHPFVGSGGGGGAGAGEPALQSGLSAPCHGAFDAMGNFLFTDRGSDRVLMHDAATGAVTTFVGTGVSTGSIDGEGGKSQDNLGDGKLATRASLWSPGGLAFNSQGDLFIADRANHRVRKVSRATGVITTVAGVGTPGFAGDGGPAIEASLKSPADVAVDALDNILIADTENGSIRRVDAASGIIETVAGVGVSSDGSDGVPAVSSYLNQPSSVSVDPQGNILITDTRNHRIRLVSRTTGIIDALAGTGTRVGAIDGDGGFPADDFGEGGPATQAALSFPRDAVFDASGNLLIADGDTFLIRKVEYATGVIATLSADINSARGDGHPATHAFFFSLTGVAVNQAGDLFIADRDRVRRVDSVSGVISTVAGCHASCSTQPGVPATSFQFSDRLSIAVTAAGDLLIADFHRHGVYRVDSASAILALVAGNGGFGRTGDGGQAVMAGIGYPHALATNSAGDFFILQNGDLAGQLGGMSFVRRIDGGTGIITTVAGGGSLDLDGIPATTAMILRAEGLAIDPSGNLFISAGRVRRVDAATGLISTVAGKGGGKSVATKWVFSPRGLAVDDRGGLLIADTAAHRILRLDLLRGVLEVVAGSGQGGFFGDGGLATNAGLSVPLGVAIAPNGDMLIADSFNNRVRRVAAAVP